MENIENDKPLQHAAPPDNAGFSGIASGTSDAVAVKAYEVFSQLDPEMQAIAILPSSERTELTRSLLGNTHHRRTLGGTLGLGSGVLSLIGGGAISLMAETAVASGVAVSLVAGGFVLSAFGLMVILGKKPSGKEAKELAGAVIPNQKNANNKKAAK
mgnify:CR=1 FL=1